MLSGLLDEFRKGFCMCCAVLQANGGDKTGGQMIKPVYQWHWREGEWQDLLLWGRLSFVPRENPGLRAPTTQVETSAKAFCHAPIGSCSGCSNKNLGDTTRQWQTSCYLSMWQNNYQIPVIFILYPWGNWVGCLSSDFSVPSLGVLRYSNVHSMGWVTWTHPRSECSNPWLWR